MKFLKLERTEYLYLLRLLKNHQFELTADVDSHARAMNANLLLKMETPTPDAKLCVIHGDGPLDMEKDAECNICEDNVSETECPHCKPTEGAVNWVPGCIFVGWGHGWQTCRYCNGTQRIKT
jgi:hypothetical protein